MFKSFIYAFQYLLRWLLFLSFILLMSCVTIHWFAYVEPSMHPRDEFHLVMEYIPFSVLLNLVCECFVESFASLSIRDIGL